MATPRFLQLIGEFLSPDRAESRAVPILDGNLSANDDLDALDALVEQDLLEPDDVVVDGAGTAYISSADWVWRLASGQTTPEKYAQLPDTGGALALEADGTVLAAVAGQGLARIDRHGDARLIATEADGAPLASITAIAVRRDGRIVVTDGSRTNRAEDWLVDLMQHGSSGRVVEIGAETKVLADGLAWPHGVAEGERGLLVTESWRHRVLRLPTAGGPPEEVVANLPGYPARINVAGDRRFWLGFISLRTHLTEFLLREDEYREDMMRSIPRPYWIGPALRTTGERWEPLQVGGMKHLSITKPWAPPRSYGLVARLDERGVFTTSLHSRAAGSRHGTLSARPHGDRLLVASKGGRTVLSAEVAR